MPLLLEVLAVQYVCSVCGVTSQHLTLRAVLQFSRPCGVCGVTSQHLTLRAVLQFSRHRGEPFVVAQFRFHPVFGLGNRSVVRTAAVFSNFTQAE